MQSILLQDYEREQEVEMDKISIIVPCFNEEETLVDFNHEIRKTVIELTDNYEIIYVDDGSADGTLDILRNLANENMKVKYLSFSRNFGKEAAMFAGLEEGEGDYFVIMDADFQDPPALLKTMYQTIKMENIDCVATRRQTRTGEPKIRSFCSRKFYKLINNISDIQLMDGARDYRIMSRKYVNAVLSVRESNRFSKGIFQWVGYETKWLSYDNIERKSGKTKWSFKKLLSYSINGITAFSTVPLAMVSVLGLITCLAALLLAIIFICQKLFIGINVQGYTAMITIILFLGGAQLFCIGIVGLYIAKIYMEVKGRPLYLLKESLKEVNHFTNMDDITIKKGGGE